MSEKVSVEISKDLYEKALKYIESCQGEFKDVSELVEFVLRELLSEEEEENVFTPEEEEKIKERLRSLGYI
ncbi:MAG: CopG family transcriptional regulator [Thermoprotei archaeon]|nr:MAG: CopG family transcriptional regulator [Thermoprotei archaeon]